MTLQLLHSELYFFYQSTLLVFYRAGIFKKSMGARHRVGIGLSYRPARLHRLTEFIPWNRFLGSINVLKYGLSTPGTMSARRKRKELDRNLAVCEYTMWSLLCVFSPQNEKFDR